MKYLFFALILTGCGLSNKDRSLLLGTTFLSSPGGFDTTTNTPTDASNNSRSDTGGDGSYTPTPAPGVVNPPVTGQINTSDRASVVSAYKNIFQANVPDPEWTGNTAGCVAGTTSLAFQTSVIQRINYYRGLTGSNPVGLRSDNTGQQEAALMMAANGSLSHSPPADWKCYTSAGASGAGSSNLALGTNGPWAIDMYIDDWGSNNQAVGHRRWILYPAQGSIATGDVNGSNALGVFGDWGGIRPANQQFVSWPSPGYFPYQNLPGSNRWSFSSSTFGISSTSQVTIHESVSGTTYPVSILDSSYGYGDPTLVWEIQGFPKSAPAQDTTYVVTITNVQQGNESKTITYAITLIDPDKAL